MFTFGVKFKCLPLCKLIKKRFVLIACDIKIVILYLSSNIYLGVIPERPLDVYTSTHMLPVSNLGLASGYRQDRDEHCGTV